MFAIISIGCSQFRVKVGDILFVDRISTEAGSDVSFEKVLCKQGDNGELSLGDPIIKDASVKATVLDHVKDAKIISFKKRRRKNSRTKRGHRRQLTKLKIIEII